jgi:DNA-binding NarL/FixJ family response regulator
MTTEGETGLNMNRPTGEGEAGTLVALSRRQQEVLRLICEARRTTEIAQALGIAESSASDYIFRLCQRVSVSGRQELMLWGHQNPGAIDGKPGRVGLRPGPGFFLKEAA